MLILLVTIRIKNMCNIKLITKEEALGALTIITCKVFIATDWVGAAMLLIYLLDPPPFVLLCK